MIHIPHQFCSTSARFERELEIIAVRIALYYTSYIINGGDPEAECGGLSSKVLFRHTPSTTQEQKRNISAADSCPV